MVARRVLVCLLIISIFGLQDVPGVSLKLRFTTMYLFATRLDDRYQTRDHATGGSIPAPST